MSQSLAALHESAHACVALALGAEVRLVSIMPTRRASGWVSWHWPGMFTVGDETAVSLSGYVAEAEAGHPHPAYGPTLNLAALGDDGPRVLYQIEQTRSNWWVSPTPSMRNCSASPAHTSAACSIFGYINSASRAASTGS